MVESTPSCQRRPPCKKNKEESDEAADAAALTYLLTEGSLAVIVYVSIFPQLCLICVHMPISGLPFWCNSCTCPPPCLLVHRETTGVLNGSPQCGLDWIVLGSWVLQGIRVCVKEPFSISLWESADPGEEQDSGSDGLWWKGNSRGRSW